MKNKINLVLFALILFSCGESTVTEHFKRVETNELILNDQHGKNYSLQVDEEGNVKALEVSKEGQNLPNASGQRIDTLKRQ